MTTEREAQVMSEQQDYRCDRFRDRVQRTKDWREEHEGHGSTMQCFIEEPQPPSYTILTMVCPCGAKHYTIKGSEDRRP